MKSCAVVVSLFLAFTCAYAQSLRAQIDASDKAIHKLMIAKDAKGFRSYLKTQVTSDFKYVEGGQTMNFDKMCDGVTQGFAQLNKITKADSTILSLKETGNKATATIKHAMEGTVQGPDKKTHKMGFTGTSTDLYVKKAGKWKLAKMTWGTQTMTMDGKPMGAMPQGSKG